MLWCFVLVFNRSRASSAKTRPTSTHIGWRVKENFPETFTNVNLWRKKIKMLFTGLGQSVLRETVPSVWVGLGQYSRPRAQFLPIRTFQPVNNIYILAQKVSLSKIRKKFSSILTTDLSAFRARVCLYYLLKEKKKQVVSCGTIIDVYNL